MAKPRVVDPFGYYHLNATGNFGRLRDEAGRARMAYRAFVSDGLVRWSDQRDGRVAEA
jgi:hypothetical protein